jgi:hypothetical protein
VRPFIKLGHINSEVREALIKSLNTVKAIAEDNMDHPTGATPDEARAMQTKYANDVKSI